MRKPQVIEDQEHERVFDRVAAVDVAKASGMVCTRTPNPSRPGARHSTVWEVQATMNAVLALAARLVADGVEMVTLESTATTGGSGTTCWKAPGWRCSWSPLARPGTCPAGPRPTGWTRCGWPG